jgi:uncharacterized protein YyaL (SSP411 family)
MEFQSHQMHIYALGYAAYHDLAYLEAARSIERFTHEFLRGPEGQFYVSMDADLHPGQHAAEYFALPDAGRRKLGIPRVDTHVYARENGWMIEALTTLYAVTGRQQYLDEALAAARWIEAHRALREGGFGHDEYDAAGPYLGDTLAMGRAYLALYAATADRPWLEKSMHAADFIQATFAESSAGYATAVGGGEQLDENISLTRWSNLLAAYSGKSGYTKTAQSAMRWIAGAASSRGWTVGGILLADAELSAPPTHMTVVGHQTDPAARALFLSALALPLTYRRLEWYDAESGPLFHMDVDYPALSVPALFMCTGNSCSAPISDPAQIARAVQRATDSP